LVREVLQIDLGVLVSQQDREDPVSLLNLEDLGVLEFRKHKYFV
jgi:hypothetical protein